ncbi:Guanine nucleotide exchange factor DBS [Nymphon striatum]|nr:Guanine nucleotide exchange factor DBS [Nymphon striatum]
MTIPFDDMMDDGGGCSFSVVEVEDLLRHAHIFLTGGKADQIYSIITFPDNGKFSSLTDERYRKLILYIVSVPPLQDADLGFVLIIDRRNDKWSSVKAALLKISSFFPGLVETVYIIRPSGFFQKAISEVSHKFFKDELKFKVIVCNCIEELHQYIDNEQLTQDLGGSIVYSNDEWIEHRLAVEKFSENAQNISKALRELTRKLQETEFPNDVQSTESLLEHQSGKYNEVKDDLRVAINHGDSLLSVIKNRSTFSKSQSLSEIKKNTEMHPNKLINVTTVERLLIQLDETEKGLDNFWNNHEKRLSQCLELRKFEQEFKELQMNIEADTRDLNEMTEVGDSVARVDILLKEAIMFRKQSLDDICKAQYIQQVGEQLIEANHYAVDSIQPKCVELQRMCNELKVKMEKRIDTLERYRDLQTRIEKANKWCTRGVDLLASQQLEKCSSPEFADVALAELEDFLQKSTEFKLSDPQEFKNIFSNMITVETKALVQQVLKRIEDVQIMCHKRKDSLKKIISKSKRPIQSVNPEPAIPLLITDAKNPSTIPRMAAAQEGLKKSVRKAKTLPKMQLEGRLDEMTQYSSEATNELQNEEQLLIKQNRVMTELIETEETYVSELLSIIEGYKVPIDKPECREKVPNALQSKTKLLFGNLEEIYKFHNDVFLKDLKNYSSSPELVGVAFTEHKETFHELYSFYCLNKPKSDSLRKQCGDNNQFLKDCQKNLGHRLPLGAYLLKPVQRITKYQLLLKDLIKYSPVSLDMCNLTLALDSMLTVVKHVNDSLHQVAITGFHGDLTDFGRLLMHESFSVWIEHKKDKIKDIRFKAKSRHVFLYEQLVLFTKKSIKEMEKASYHFKNALKMSQIGLTENVKGSRGDKKKFELWLHGRTEVYTIQAPTLEVKNEWVKEIKRVLIDQLEKLKGENIKQYPSQSYKMPEFVEIPTAHQKLHHTESDDACTTKPYLRNQNNNVMSTEYQQKRSPEPLTRRATEPSIPFYPHDGWSSEEYSDEEEDAFEAFNGISQVLNTRYFALEDYNAVDVGEVSMREGDIVEVVRVGCAGYWYVKLTNSYSEGWVPASYLERLITQHHPFSRSSASVSSQDSNGLNRATSRSSVASTNSHEGVCGGTLSYSIIRPMPAVLLENCLNDVHKSFLGICCILCQRPNDLDSKVLIDLFN